MPTKRHRSRRLLLLLLLAVLAVLPSLRADDITLADGSVIADVQAIRVYPDRIVVRSADGVQAVDMERLSVDLQVRFDYDPARAAAYRDARVRLQAEQARRRQRTAIMRRLTDELERDAVRISGRVLAETPQGDMVIHAAVEPVKGGGFRTMSTVVSDLRPRHDGSVEARAYPLGRMTVIDYRTRESQQLQWWTTSLKDALRLRLQQDGAELEALRVAHFADPERRRVVAAPVFASGAIIEPGLIVCGADAVAGRDQVWLRRGADAQPVRARVRHVDELRGLALIELPADWADAPRLSLAAAAPKSQTAVYSLSFPGGIFSPERGHFGRGAMLTPPGLATTDGYYASLSVESGAEGSAVVDSRGQLVGLLSGRRIDTGPHQKPFAHCLSVEQLRGLLQDSQISLPRARPERPPADSAELAARLQASAVQLYSGDSWPSWR